MGKTIGVISILSVLAACGTPQEQCLLRETRDLRAVNRMISETEGNLNRGFAYYREEIFHSVYVRCGGYGSPVPGGGGRGGAFGTPGLCLDDREYTVTRTKPFNPPAEQAKLTELKSQRTKLLAAADRSALACRRAYPE